MVSNGILAALCLLCLAVGLLGGVLIGERIQGHTGEPKEWQEPPAAVPPRLQTQFENLLSYDGTGRGQREVDG